jgi:release factor glutamine methyltransferase
MNLAPDTSREQAFRAGVTALKEAGVESPALDAAILLGHATGESGPQALLSRAAPLSTLQAASYEEFIQKRCQREAVSRIIGSREFYSRPFEVTSHVLDPRPETEILVGEAIKWLAGTKGPVRVMDVGTGSGAIAVTVAAELPGARVVATDISREALGVAARNAVAHSVDERIEFIIEDLTSATVSRPAFDMIISNPPYITQEEFEWLQVEVRVGDPVEALVAGPEGVEFYPLLAALAVKALRPGGRIMVEVGSGQAEKVSLIFREAGLFQVGTFRDLVGIDRVVTGAVNNA